MSFLAAFNRMCRGSTVRFRVLAGWLRTGLHLGLLVSLAVCWSKDPGLGLPATASPQGQIEKNPAGQGWPGILERVRAKALTYTDQLPNFICQQTTQRFIRSVSPVNRHAVWRKTDSFVAALSFYDMKEHYEIVSINQRAAKGETIEKLSGEHSTGEFLSALRGLFEPNAKAVFRQEGTKKINKVRTLCIAFEVPRETSKRSITYNDQTIITAYRGKCWVDPVSYQVVRLEKKAVDLPRGFPVNRFDVSIEYAPAKIAEDFHWLPKEAQVWIDGWRWLSAKRGLQLHTKHIIQFDGYRRFETGVKLMIE